MSLKSRFGTLSLMKGIPVWTEINRIRAANMVCQEVLLGHLNEQVTAAVQEFPPSRATPQKAFMASASFFSHHSNAEKSCLQPSVKDPVA